MAVGLVAAVAFTAVPAAADASACELVDELTVVTEAVSCTFACDAWQTVTVWLQASGARLTASCGGSDPACGSAALIAWFLQCEATRGANAFHDHAGVCTLTPDGAVAVVTAARCAGTPAPF